MVSITQNIPTKMRRIRMKPNFFILGAPKAGTSALAKYLSAHPQVSMSAIKEPHFFNSDHGHSFVLNSDEYSALFNTGSPLVLAIGEASVWYLYSEVAVRNIEANIADARYIVMLRNPYTMAPALHSQHLYAGYEDFVDFNAAWNAQWDRSNGHRVPKKCPSKDLLLYAKACQLGAQLNQLYDLVPSKRVLVVFQEDMHADPKSIWSRVQAFLNIDDDGRSDFPKFNTAKSLRNATLRKVQILSRDARKAIGLNDFSIGLGAFINRLNIGPKNTPSINTTTALEMTEAFEADISLISRITERDLSHWVEHGKRLVQDS